MLKELFYKIFPPRYDIGDAVILKQDVLGEDMADNFDDDLTYNFGLRKETLYGRVISLNAYHSENSDYVVHFCVKDKLNSTIGIGNRNPELKKSRLLHLIQPELFPSIDETVVVRELLAGVKS